MGIPEGEEKQNRRESILKAKMDENISNLGREMDTKIHEDQRIPNKFNPNRTTLRYIIIKLSKVRRQRILKSAKERKLV